MTAEDADRAAPHPHFPYAGGRPAGATPESCPGRGLLWGVVRESEAGAATTRVPHWREQGLQKATAVGMDAPLSPSGLQRIPACADGRWFSRPQVAVRTLPSSQGGLLSTWQPRPCRRQAQTEAHPADRVSAMGQALGLLGRGIFTLQTDRCPGVVAGGRTD